MHQTNVLEYLEKTVTRVPDKLAFSNGEEGLTFAEVYHDSRAIGSYLASKGYYGEPVVVFMRKHPTTLTAFFGTMYAGCYYVQEASSMFVGEVLNQYLKKDSIVLDLCAAPGGKSTLISQYLGEEGLLVSNEVVRQRVFILSENIQKWGNGNTVVTHNYAADFGNKLENLFDCILVDAPCSGEGMFRKEPSAVSRACGFN